MRARLGKWEQGERKCGRCNADMHGIRKTSKYCSKECRFSVWGYHRFTKRAGEISTHVFFTEHVQNCRECIGSFMCDEHKRLYNEQVIPYNRRRETQDRINNLPIRNL